MKSEMMKAILVIIGVLVVNSAAGSFTDSRDGQTYKTVKIGEQTWMAENLNYSEDYAGCYEDQETNCNKYGRLYHSAGNNCPSGWHVPSIDEWKKLWNAVGGYDVAGIKLKSTSGWKEGGNGKDVYGFAVLPAGQASMGEYGGEEFHGEGVSATFFTSTIYDRHAMYGVRFRGDSVHLVSIEGTVAETASVRCLRNSFTSQVNPKSVVKGTMKDARNGQKYKTVKIGNQTWMAENLNYEVNDGKQSWCFDNKPANCKRYGRLYTWAAAVGKSEEECFCGDYVTCKRCPFEGPVQGVCPAGWHLPSSDEWKELSNAVGDVYGAGIDAYGFDVLSAGHWDDMMGFQSGSSFWSSSGDASVNNYDVLSYYGQNVAIYEYGSEFAFSVRCVLNSNADGEKSVRSMAQEDFREKMKNVHWKKISGRISVPSFMEQIKGDNPFYEYFVYDKVMILNPDIPAHWDGYLSEGGLIAPDVKVRNITYKRKSISSGYTDDDRIFYLKTLYYPSCATSGYYVSYILIYPKEYQKAVGPIINMILHWDYTKEECEASLARPSGAGAGTVQNLGTMKDSRDGQTYRTVKIGEQTWMAENLNYKVNDGEQSWCYYNEKSNCNKYGRLYTWAASVDKPESQCGHGKDCNLRGRVQGVCPSGWHLPSKEEWETLFRYIGGGGEWYCKGEICFMWYPNIGKKLKSISGWYDGGNGTDAYGFSALPAGSRINGGDFGIEGDIASFWSSSEYDSGYACNMFLLYKVEDTVLLDSDKSYALSVRCIQDN